MTNKDPHSLVKKCIHMYEDAGMTVKEIAEKLKEPEKRIQKIIDNNCNVFGE